MWQFMDIAVPLIGVMLVILLLLLAAVGIGALCERWRYGHAPKSAPRRKSLLEEFEPRRWVVVAILLFGLLALTGNAAAQSPEFRAEIDYKVFSATHVGFELTLSINQPVHYRLRVFGPRIATSPKQPLTTGIDVLVSIPGVSQPQVTQGRYVRRFPGQTSRRWGDWEGSWIEVHAPYPGSTRFTVQFLYDTLRKLYASNVGKFIVIAESWVPERNDIGSIHFDIPLRHILYPNLLSPPEQKGGM